MLIWIVAIFIFIAILLLFIYASYSIQTGVYLKTLCKNPKKGKVVALTFDDGPDPEQTHKILDILKKYDVKGCFFCIGNKVKDNPEIVRRIINEGHLIGNHSYTHTFSFPLYSVKRITEELQSTEKEIEKITGKRTLLFRPPFGVTNPTIAKVIKKLDYITIGWSIRSLDTKGNEEKALKRIQDKIHPGAVILLHDTMPFSDSLLLKVLDFLKKNEYNIVTPDTLFDIKRLTQ
ncbi:MAG: polysaccharide deacetylase family protein [Dysgonomonas sp.]|nr:polysaccharide deacetylase family protein [Dysgonomonas sp.]